MSSQENNVKPQEIQQILQYSTKILILLRNSATLSRLPKETQQ